MVKVCKTFVVLICILILLVPSIVYAGKTERVSISSDGIETNSNSSNPSISADGRFIVYISQINNLVLDDTNECPDVFVYDRKTGRTQRVSVSSDGKQANDESDSPAISADGRFIAFESKASNLVSDDTNKNSDIFVYDRQTGKIQIASVSSDGKQANGYSCYPSISADGRFIAYASYASNLASDDTNECSDIYVHDRQTGKTHWISASNDRIRNNSHGCYYPFISANGRFVAFVSWRDDLEMNTSGVFVYDRLTGNTEFVSMLNDEKETYINSYSPSMSADGQFVVFITTAFTRIASNCQEGYTGVFIHNRQTHKTKRLSMSDDGELKYGSSGYSASISSDGRFIAFISLAAFYNDTNGQPDVFVYNRLTDKTQRISSSNDVVMVNHFKGLHVEDNSPSISADGRFVAYESWTNNQVPGDTNDNSDIFVHETDFPVEGVSINKSTISLCKGASETLVATVNPSDATDRTLRWSSDNDAIAKVDANGKVTAVSVGNCTIEVRTVDEAKIACCSVNVKSRIYFTSPSTSDSCARVLNVIGIGDNVLYISSKISLQSLWRMWYSISRLKRVDVLNNFKK